MEACFADVFGLQQLRVLQHNRQDHRIDAGPSVFLSDVNIAWYQETCNLLIDMARKFLDPNSIFQIEVNLISPKLKNVDI